MDWSGCPIVEVNPKKVSGAPLLIGTRLPAAAIVVNYQGGSSVEEIADNYDIPEETVRIILRYAYAASLAAA